MKKNNIKTKKDGTNTYENENIWMHSIDRPVKKNELKDALISIVILIATLVAFYLTAQHLAS